MRCAKTCLLSAKTYKTTENTKFFCPLLDISVSGSLIIQDGERCDRRRWRMNGAERVAAVDKIEDLRKPEDFIGHRNRKTGRRGDTCPRQRSHHRIWHLHRQYVRRSGITVGTPLPGCPFSWCGSSGHPGMGVPTVIFYPC